MCVCDHTIECAHALSCTHTYSIHTRAHTHTHVHRHRAVWMRRLPRWLRCKAILLPSLPRTVHTHTRTHKHTRTHTHTHIHTRRYAHTHTTHTHVHRRRAEWMRRLPRWLRCKAILLPSLPRTVASSSPCNAWCGWGRAQSLKLGRRSVWVRRGRVK